MYSEIYEEIVKTSKKYINMQYNIGCDLSITDLSNQTTIILSIKDGYIYCVTGSVNIDEHKSVMYPMPEIPKNRIMLSSPNAFEECFYMIKEEMQSMLDEERLTT